MKYKYSLRAIFLSPVAAFLISNDHESRLINASFLFRKDPSRRTAWKAWGPMIEISMGPFRFAFGRLSWH